MEDCSNTTIDSPIDGALIKRGIGYAVSTFKKLSKDYESYISLPGIRQWGGCWLESLEIYDGLWPLTNSPIFRVAYTTLQPYVIKTIQNDTIELSGFLIEFWTTLGETLDFRTEFLEMEEDVAKKLLLHGSIDAYLHPTVILPKEDKLFEYTIPVASLWYQLFIKKPETKVSGAAFIRAMSPGMWLMTVAAIIILSMALWGTAAIRLFIGADSGLCAPRDLEVAPYEYESIVPQSRRARTEIEQKQSLSAGSCFLSVLGVLCNQGWQDDPDTGSLRLVSFSSLIFGFMVYNAYAAVLVSYLATGSTLLPFKGLEHVARVRSHALCVRPESYAHSIFVDSVTNEPLPAWEGLINADVCLAGEEITTIGNDEIDKDLSSIGVINASHAKMTWNPIPAMCSGRGAVLENPSVITSMATQLPDDCHIVPVGERTLPSFVSILLRPDFPYTHAIDVNIVRLRSSGITSYMQQKWFGIKPRAVGTNGGGSIITSSGIEREDGNLYVQVSLGHVGSVLFVYGACMLIPVLILLIEIAIYRTRSRKKPKRRKRPAPHLRNGVINRSNKVPVPVLLFRRYKEPKLLRP